MEINLINVTHPEVDRDAVPMELLTDSDAMYPRAIEILNDLPNLQLPIENAAFQDRSITNINASDSEEFDLYLSEEEARMLLLSLMIEDEISVRHFQNNTRA